MFKKLFQNVKEFNHTIKDPKSREQLFFKILSSKKLFWYGFITNVIGLSIYSILINDKIYEISLTRFISRWVGRLGNTTVPESLRERLYNLYMKTYNVNREEIVDQNLKNYKNIKEFFIRHIDLTKRPINESNEEVLTSPCDGTILSISELESYDYLFIIKNIKYSLTEFLFGNQFKNFSYLADNLFQDKKKTFQITIYLSPGDCHRYYSPADLNITDRVYIPGFLEPVRPSYLKKHPKVFLTNERVTLRCLNKKNDLVFITYVGALNVGSVNLSFDDFLQTNKKLNSFEKSDPGFFVLRYTDIIKPKTKVFERKPLIFFRPSSPLLLQDIEKESQEFDMRDMINLDIDIVKDYKIKREDIKSSYLSFKENFLFHLIMYGKEELKYNLYNSFLSYDIELHKKKMKLQNPKELKLEKYTISEEGLKMNRKEEMGWFNFGSTIVLIFTVDKEKEINFKFKEGDIVKIGQSLYDLKYNKELI